MLAKYEITKDLSFKSSAQETACSLNLTINCLLKQIFKIHTLKNKTEARVSVT